MGASSYNRTDPRARGGGHCPDLRSCPLEVILQKLVEIARSQVNSRYAALSVLDVDGHIEQFVTSGIGEAERTRIGHIPEGHGLLGVLLREGESLRLADMSQTRGPAGFRPTTRQ